MDRWRIAAAAAVLCLFFAAPMAGAPRVRRQAVEDPFAEGGPLADADAEDDAEWSGAVDAAVVIFLILSCMLGLLLHSKDPEMSWKDHMFGDMRETPVGGGARLLANGSAESPSSATAGPSEETKKAGKVNVEQWLATSEMNVAAEEDDDEAED
jgi:hypothetical protein